MGTIPTETLYKLVDSLSAAREGVNSILNMYLNVIQVSVGVMVRSPNTFVHIVYLYDLQN